MSRLLRPSCLLLAVIFVAAPATAGWLDFERGEKPWQEIQAQLPAAPKEENLVAFPVSAATRHSHYLDRASLSAGEDGVVRYTVLVRAAAGAENISFEGMRCATGERKIYALGRPGGEWSPNRDARWEPTNLHQATSYQRELFYHYFCTLQGPADLKVIAGALRRGGLAYDGD